MSKKPGGLDSFKAIQFKVGDILPLTPAGKLEMILELIKDYDDIYDEYGDLVGRTYREPILSPEEIIKILDIP
jgi:hypothetical protein